MTFKRNLKVLWSNIFPDKGKPDRKAGAQSHRSTSNCLRQRDYQMQKAHPTFSFAQKSSLREASRAGRFSKRWHLSRRQPARPQPLNTTAKFRDKISDGKKV
jgi:hypothetical protein